MVVSYKQCPICNNWGFSDGHRCPPIWEYNIEETMDDEWQEMRSLYPDDIAENAAEIYDHEGEYYLIQNSGDAEVIVSIRNPETKEIFKYKVTGESVPTYTAHLIKD